MKSNSTTYCTIALLTVLFLSPAEPALAQQEGAAVLEEVIVTARRREESLQDLPLSVVAFSADQLQANAVYRVEQLDEFVPNLTMRDGDRTGHARIFIRGVGGGSPNPSIEFGTGLYIDGLYIPRSIGAFFGLVDVERIEVLRGPQGTLFGKNTTGGLVNVITRKPGPEFEADATLRAGSFGQRDARFSVNVPLIADTLYTRAAVAYEGNDGFYTNVRTGKGFSDNQVRAIYSATRWIPNDSWTVDFSGQFSDEPRTMKGAKCIYVQFKQRQEQRYNIPSGDPKTFEQHCRESEAAGGNDPHSFISNLDGFADTTSAGISANAAWAGPIGGLDAASLNIRTSLRSMENTYLHDNDMSAAVWEVRGTPKATQGGLNVGNELDTQDFEVIFNTAVLDDTLDLTFGYYHYESNWKPQGDDCHALFSQVKGTGQDIPCPNAGGTTISELTRNFITEKWMNNVSDAFFFHGTLDIGENWFVDFGGRQTEDKRDIRSFEFNGTFTSFGIIENVLNDSTVSSHTTRADVWSEFTPMASLSRRIGGGESALDDGTVYLSYAEGFLTGGFNSEGGPQFLELFGSYQPEFVESVELGLKSTWGDGRFRLNASFFDMDYADKQEEVRIENPGIPGGPTIELISNAASLDITGFELEAQYRSPGGLMIDFSASSLDNEYSQFDVFDRDTGFTVDNTDAIIRDFTADWTVAASVGYEFTSASGSTLIPRLGVYAQDDYDFQGQRFGQPPSRCNQKSYTEWNGRVTWVSPGGNTQVALHVDNLSDELILRSCVFSGFRGRGILDYEAPRWWTLEANFRF